jgi:hypothetical protein
LHEIGHAVGLYHEHQRDDRNESVDIRFENIYHSARPNYAKQTGVGEDIGPYDHASIMHYPQRSEFGIDANLDEIVLPVGAPAVGQRTNLSTGDIACLELTYRDRDGWHRMDGSLDSITVGAVNEIWGINKYRQTFRLLQAPPSLGPPWQQMPAPNNLIQISAAQDGSVWTVDIERNIFRWTGVSPAFWDYVPGRLTHVSAGSATNVWGVNERDEIYQWTAGAGPNGSWGFQRRDGPPLMMISAAADGSLWGVNSSYGIFRWDAGLNTFVTVDGSLCEVSNGGGRNVWGINSPVHRQIFPLIDDVNYRWQHIDGELLHVSAGNDGTVWV